MRVISGRARGVRLKTPEGMQTRPTADRVKEALFSILQFELPGKKILDLFGGTGQLGIEAISRGAKETVFVDQSDKACKLIRENLRLAKMEDEGRVIRSDYLAFLRSTKEKFDIILLDPPYAEVFLENALNLITEIDILQSGGIIATEYPFGKVLPAEYSEVYRAKEYKYGKTILTIFRKND